MNGRHVFQPAGFASSLPGTVCVCVCVCVCVSCASSRRRRRLPHSNTHTLLQHTSRDVVKKKKKKQPSKERRAAPAPAAAGSFCFPEWPGRRLSTQPLTTRHTFDAQGCRTGEGERPLCRGSPGGGRCSCFLVCVRVSDRGRPGRLLSQKARRTTGRGPAAAQR
jgi:hypothetical protein